MTLLSGATVGRYTILEPLGQGGMATVYTLQHADDTKSARFLAHTPGG